MPRDKEEPNPLADNPRVDRTLIERLLEVQPSRPDVSQGQRRMQLERAVDWLEAIAVTIGRVGYRIEWRLSPMPVRWRPDDRGLLFDIAEYLTSTGWVPLGQLYGCPPPTDNPLPLADYVYPPYAEDMKYVKYMAETTALWAHFHKSQGRLELRRKRYAERRLQGASARARKFLSLRWFQAHWELRDDVTVRCLRWVNTREPHDEPLVIPRIEALPSLHPCGVWGDILESPTRREEPTASAPWPPPGMDDIEPPPNVSILYPVLRDPAGREVGGVVPPSRHSPPRRRQAAERARKRLRAVAAAASERALSPRSRPSEERALSEQGPEQAPRSPSVSAVAPLSQPSAVAPALEQPLETPQVAPVTTEPVVAPSAPLVSEPVPPSVEPAVEPLPAAVEVPPSAAPTGKATLETLLVFLQRVPLTQTLFGSMNCSQFLHYPKNSWSYF